MKRTRPRKGSKKQPDEKTWWKRRREGLRSHMHFKYRVILSEGGKTVTNTCGEKISWIRWHYGYGGKGVHGGDGEIKMTVRRTCGVKKRIV